MSTPTPAPPPSPDNCISAPDFVFFQFPEREALPVDTEKRVFSGKMSSGERERERERALRKLQCSTLSTVTPLPLLRQTERCMKNDTAPPAQSQCALLYLLSATSVSVFCQLNAQSLTISLFICFLFSGGGLWLWL